jgi:hypothetical protein
MSPSVKENTSPGEGTIIVSLLRYGRVAYILRVCRYVSSGVPIISKDRSVMQGGRAGFRSVTPVGWASSPSIKRDGQSRVLPGTTKT